MIPKPFEQITEIDIKQLATAGIAESKTIEYKRDLPGTRDEDKREFLADISSFANTDGGDIIYGVVEEQGMITETVGAEAADFDGEILRLESLVRDGIAPRLQASFRAISCGAGKLMIARIEKSWNRPPHRVIFRSHDKFYGRTSGGKYSLDVTQLRSSFLESAALSDQIKGFRVDRIIDIRNDQAPVLLRPEPKRVLHIIPVTALSDERHFDVGMFFRTPSLHQPWNGSGWARMTLDRALTHTYEDEFGRSYSYAHFRRNGIFEGVTASLLETTQVPGHRLIPNVVLEREVLNYLPHCLSAMELLGVPLPVFVALSLINVRGLEMATARFPVANKGNEIREETIMLPGAMVESFSAPAGPILKPMFDRVWNACGYIESPNFDRAGNWRGHN